MVPEIWFMTDGWTDGQMDRQLDKQTKKVTHREVGAPPIKKTHAKVTRISNKYKSYRFHVQWQHILI